MDAHPIHLRMGIADLCDQLMAERDIVAYLAAGEGPVTITDMENAAGHCIDGWPDNVGDFATWTRLALAAGRQAPLMGWSESDADASLEAFLLRFTAPAVEAFYAAHPDFRIDVRTA